MKEHSRLSRLKQKLSQRPPAALLVTCRENIRYLSGFTGSSGMLLVTAHKAVLITDFRYAIQAQEEVADAEVRLGRKPLEELRQLLTELNPRGLAFEAESLTYDNYEKISLFCRQQALELIPSRRMVAELRLVKEPAELERIRQAISIAQLAFQKAVAGLKPGISERDLAFKIEFEARRAGSGKAPFDIIVAAGERSAMPHGLASDRLIGANELLVIDFGASYKGYKADISRTLLLGAPSPRQREIYQLVKCAQAAAMAGVMPGMKAQAVDKLAREVIEAAGYGEYFGHGTGHGVGLEVHEGPGINHDNQTRLVPGMVFTIEPGVYLPGVGGVRIEDMVLVTEGGAEVLTGLPRELVTHVTQN